MNRVSFTFVSVFPLSLSSTKVGIYSLSAPRAVDINTTSIRHNTRTTANKCQSLIAFYRVMKREREGERGREGGREGGRGEGRREGGREGGGKEGGREKERGGREGGRRERERGDKTA